MTNSQSGKSSRKASSTSADIVAYLEKQDMTRNEIAELLGVSVSYLSRVARMERKFTIDHLERLAGSLAMTLPELIMRATPVESVPAGLQSSYKLLLKGLKISSRVRAGVRKKGGRTREEVGA